MFAINTFESMLCRFFISCFFLATAFSVAVRAQEAGSEYDIEQGLSPEVVVEEKGFQSHVDVTLALPFVIYESGDIAMMGGVTYVGGYRFNHTHYLGMGLGIWCFVTYPIIPVFVNYKAYFKEKNNLSLLVDGSVGMSTLAFEHFSYLVEANFGFSYKLTPKLSLCGEVGLHSNGAVGEPAVGPAVKFGISF